jgi:UDP-3-O-[3-hydroxymyristoyl] glucosamine N-acyltransferase
MILSVEKIALLIDASISGDPSTKISGINTLEDANHLQIAYAVDNKHIDSLSKTKAGAVIIHKSLEQYCSTNSLLVENVYLAFAILSHHFKKYSSVIDKSEAQLLLKSARAISGVLISPGCFIGKNVTIGVNTVIGPNSVIEDDVEIGENSIIGSNVTIYRASQIKKRCSISSGVIIGSEGFGNAKDDNKKWYPIAHLGIVTIDDDVSIGANTTIDRGTIKNTEIHSGVKIDNLVHIAHNVIIGQNTAIAAKTGIAGTTTIGKRCMIGGMVGIVGHLTITDDVIVNATSTVNRNITKPGVYSGFVPLMTHSEWKKVGIWLTKLDKIATLLKIKLKNIK